MAYSYLKLLHLVAVIIFLGNIITGLFWMHIAVKTKDLKIIAHSINGVIRSDRLFTIPGVVFIVVAGIFTAIFGNIPILRTGWIFWSIVLFSISGFVFGWKVAPLQRKIYKLSSAQTDPDNFDWFLLKKLYKEWEIWGLIALLTPVIALFMMVLKVPK